MNPLEKLQRIPLYKLDEDTVLRDNPELQPYASGQHEVARKTHVLKFFQQTLNKTNEPPFFVLYWTWCWECKQVRNKKVILYGKDIEGRDTAYVRQIIEKGEFVD